MIQASVLKPGEGRAAGSSLFFFSCAGLLLLAASLRPAESYFWWGGIALLVLALRSVPARRLPVNALSIGLSLFCAWLFANALFFTPHYLANGVFSPVVLIGGFAAAAVLGGEAPKQLLRAMAALVALLVLIGLLQAFFGLWNYDPNSRRAAATFATPNTFATTINLLLLPLAALAISGRGGWKVYAATLWLFAGLLSTESRGGWITFLSGLVFIAAYLGLPRTRDASAHWLRLLFGLLGVIGAYYAAKALLVDSALTQGGGSLAGMLAEDIAARGSSYRIELASVALGQIAERPFSGAGANTFWPLYEMVKPPELDKGMTYPFVHNDYLQIWLEYGLPGILLLGAVMAAALVAIFKGWRADRDPVPLACGAALAAVFVHAVVDFPLYVPFPLVALGAWLGVLAVHSGDSPWARPILARAGGPLRPLWTPLVSGVVTLAAIAWLAQPVVAGLAARQALDQLNAGNPGDALYWQSVARRLEPLSGQRHWEEGITWRDQALASGDKTLGAKADARFAEGMHVDPYDVNNIVDRARLHRLHPEVLDFPASPEEILQWNAQALGVRPYMLATQVEYARALAYAGRPEEARRLANAMVAQHPDSQIARRLAAEM